jgi:glycine/D-amino acid oxidase-like deaminating enzyme
MPAVTDYRAKSYWLEQSSATYSENPPLEGLVRADALIVGGGITGISAAYHLKAAEPGLRVVLLEADAVGNGASGRSAGLIAPRFGMGLRWAVLRFGRRRALEARRYAERAVEYLGEAIRREQLECDYRPASYLRVALTPARAQRLQDEVSLARALGIQGVDWIGAGEIRSLVNSPAFLGAWHEARAALINPARLAREMKRLAVHRGAEVYERSPVTRLSLDPLIRARTPRGAVEADALILATNAFSSQFPQFRARQWPMITYAALTEPLAASQLSSLRWNAECGIEDARALAHTFHLTPDNRLLISGGDARYLDDGRSAAGADRDVGAYERLQDFIARIFPQLRGAKITHRWSGVVSATPDLSPAIGSAGRNRRVFYSVGCMGHGLALAHLNGRVMADLVLGRASEPAAISIQRGTIPLPPAPLRAPLARGVMAAMRFTDTLDERRGLGPG